ncbi:toll/interleukin-1 receptor domain-containing protein [Sphaerisporangium sp. B11E5]|uniref:toll/interleukin-1 receptor domain-containing protein n=1 Tax=Sphaerisporangium sp. B11E5 TaxID=3153563 RepID=UPI00325E5F70
MPKVFINYRTGDGEKTALTIERELTHRFGSDAVFYASKSIKPGSAYPEELLRAVRGSDALLAVIGPKWTSFPALLDETDWVRREILEAIASGIPIIPVLDGRMTARLRSVDVPPELSRLADFHSVRLDHQNAESDLNKLAKALTEQVPGLRDHTTAEDSGSVHNRVGDVDGPVVQNRDVTGDAGIVLKGDRGQLHLGKGNQYQQHFSGPGATYVEGGNEGGISHKFGGADDDDGDDVP